MQVAPDAYLLEGFASLARSYKSLETVQAALSVLDMGLEKTFAIPRELTVEARVLNMSTSKPALALAKSGVPQPRRRTAQAKGLVNNGYAALPSVGPGSQELVAAKMKDVVLVDGGTECVVGRLLKAYPRVGVVPPNPVSEFEAQGALMRCGMQLRMLPPPGLRPYPLNPDPGQQGVMVNEKSDNGFPVGGKWSDVSAAHLAMRLAESLRERFARAYRESSVGVWNEVRRMEAAEPYLVAVKGKAKADYYSVEKVQGAMLRFYNAFPRQVILNMQMATQVMEASCKSMLDGPMYRSGIGIPLVRGGAGDMVAALEAQLVAQGRAYVHVGDDSWVVRRLSGGELEMFALDCSNFDLTQHAAVTLRVHEAVRDELRLVDGVAADLWYAYARERVVVLIGSLTRRFRHGGPSGMPLQSKVNDMLMDVMITRLLAKLKGDLTEPEVGDCVESVGAGMGFVVRLEQYWRGSASTLVAALQQRSFLFIGMYFHVRDGVVMAHADIPRTFAQMPYPALKWVAEKQQLEVTEAMRLGSIILGLGMPTADLDRAFSILRQRARTLIEDVLKKHGDAADPKLRWAVWESPYGPEAGASLSGLLGALTRPPQLLWLQKEPELAGTSTLLPIVGSWADQVEEEESDVVRRAGGVAWRPPAMRGVTPVPLARRAPTTHPATRRNDGRPPPTAVWTPAKARRDRASASEEATSARTRRRDGILAREFAANRLTVDEAFYAMQAGEYSDSD